MDKQMIEEMAKVLLETSCKGSECENCSFIRSVKEAEETCVCLKALYSAGYRKISENAVVLTEERLKAIIEEEYKNALKGKVVLTREEYDELQKGIKTYNYTAMFNAQDAYRWEQGYLQGTKETAEKFAERLKEMAYQSTDWSHGVHPMVVEVDYIDEIAEEFTGDSNGH